MLCEKVLGKLSDEKFKDLKVDYVDIDWYDAFKKLHKKVSVEGREVGIRLDNDILTKGLNQDDVLGVDGDTVVAVNMAIHLLNILHPLISLCLICLTKYMV